MLLEEWNEGDQVKNNKKWHYKGVDNQENPDARNFRRDFMKAYDQIVNFFRLDTW